MSWHLKVRSIFPRSNLAKEGIQCLPDEVLPENDTTPVADRDENTYSDG